MEGGVGSGSPQVWHKMWTTTSNNGKKNTAFSCFQIPIKRLTHVFIWQLEEYTIIYFLLDAREELAMKDYQALLCSKSDNKETFNILNSSLALLVLHKSHALSAFGGVMLQCVSNFEYETAAP